MGKEQELIRRKQRADNLIEKYLAHLKLKLDKPPAKKKMELDSKEFKALVKWENKRRDLHNDLLNFMGIQRGSLEDVHFKRSLDKKYVINILLNKIKSKEELNG